MKTLQEALAENLDRTKALVANMKSVIGFKVNDALKKLIEDIAGLIEAGEEKKAFEASGQFVSIGRSTLGKFIKFSVVDKFDDEGELERKSHFGSEIEARQNDGYHEDLVAKMQKHFDILLAAVTEETNGDFTRRIAAYNEMQKVLDEVWQEQKARDRKRAAELKQAKRANGAGKKAADQAAEKERGQNQRDLVVQARINTASSLRALL